MAIYNEILAGRFARAIQRLFSMKGGVPVRQVSGELTPNLNVDDMMQLENRILLGVRTFAYEHGLAAGGAGNFGAIRLRNPVGSNAVATVEKVSFTDTSGALQSIAIAGGPIPTVVDLATNDSGNTAIRDARLGPTSGAMQVSFGTPASGLGTRIIWAGTVLANQTTDVMFYDHHELALLPGDAYTFRSSTANAAVQMSIMWRERVLEESEILVVG